MRKIGYFNSAVQFMEHFLICGIVCVPPQLMYRGKARMVGLLLQMRNQGPQGKVTQQVHGSARTRV